MDGRSWSGGMLRDPMEAWDGCHSPHNPEIDRPGARMPRHESATGCSIPSVDKQVTHGAAAFRMTSYQ